MILRAIDVDVLEDPLDPSSKPMSPWLKSLIEQAKRLEAEWPFVNSPPPQPGVRGVYMQRFLNELNRPGAQRNKVPLYKGKSRSK